MSRAKNILIVDDDLHLQTAIKHALTKEDYKVTTATGIESCKQRLMLNIPDLILLDVVLPDGNGIDFAKELAKNNTYCSVGILLMSGLKTDKPYIEEGLKSGALHFARKPFEIKSLIQQINLIFQVRELESKRINLEKRFNHFFDYASDIVFILNQNGIILDISKSFEDITGFTLNDTSDQNFGNFVATESKNIWSKNLEIIRNGNVLPSFELFLKNTFNNLLPIDIQLTKSSDKNKNEVVIIGIAKDLRTIKLLEAERFKRSEENNDNNLREFNVWESMAIPQTRLTELIYEVSALNNENSEIFGNMLSAYRQLVDEAIQYRIYKTDTENTLKKRMFANELGFLKAGPRDLIKIHTTFYKTLSGKMNHKKIAIYHEEARLVLLSVMGYLVSFYRNRNIKTYE